MPSQSEHDIEQLNRLIEATIDNAKGYHDAKAAAASSQVSTLFRERAAKRREVVLRLQTEVRRLGGRAVEDGTVIAAAQRWFTHVKNSIAGSDAAIIAKVQSGEDQVEGAYAAALQDGLISVDVRTLITSAYGTIKADHDQVRDMRQDPQAEELGKKAIGRTVGDAV